MLTPRKALVLAAAVGALVAFPTAAGAAAKASTSQTALLREINRVRSTHGLRALSFDPVLARAALAHSREMAASGVFAHGSFQSRMQQFHVAGPFVGENLAWGVGRYGSPRGIVRLWLHSPEHRANLLRPGFRRIGLGELSTRFQGFAGAAVVTADFAGV
jgi:uncharacterized protein YkwD